MRTANIMYTEGFGIFMPTFQELMMQEIPRPCEYNHRHLNGDTLYPLHVYLDRVLHGDPDCVDILNSDQSIVASWVWCDIVQNKDKIHREGLVTKYNSCPTFPDVLDYWEKWLFATYIKWFNLMEVQNEE